MKHRNVFTYETHQIFFFEKFQMFFYETHQILFLWTKVCMDLCQGNQKKLTHAVISEILLNIAYICSFQMQPNIALKSLKNPTFSFVFLNIFNFYAHLYWPSVHCKHEDTNLCIEKSFVFPKTYLTFLHTFSSHSELMSFHCVF